MNKLIKKAIKFTDAGDFRSAESIYKKILKKEPHDLDANYLLGTIYAEQHNHIEAKKYLTKASEINPSSAQVWNNLGNVYRQLGLLSHAIDCYRRALNFQWDLVQAHYNLAVSLKQLGEPEEALRHFEIVLQLNPGFMEAHAGIISLLEKEGHYGEAKSRILPLINAENTNPMILKVFAELVLHGELPDADIELAVHKLEDFFSSYESRPVSAHLKSTLSFTMGQLLDKVQRYDEAMEYFNQGNDLQGKNFDLAEHTKRIDTLLEIYDEAFVNSMPRLNEGDEQLIFIIGMPRSGTTLVEQILYSHSKVTALGESEYFGNAVQSISPNASFLDEKQLQAVKNHCQSYLDESEDSEFIVDKTLLNYLNIGMILQVFPNAKFINTIRDPLDTCLSCYFHNFSGTLDFTYDLNTLGKYYREYVRLMDHWKKVFPGHILDVRYEGLVKETNHEIKQILDFCGLEWEPAVERFYEQDRFVTTSSYHQVRKPIYSSSVNRSEKYKKFLGPLTDGLS